jgi:hypothetical protein
MKKASGYRQPYYYEGGIAKADNYRMHAWTADHARPHRRHDAADPSDAALQPFYIEFNEYLGGYNFGSSMS